MSLPTSCRTYGPSSCRPFAHGVAECGANPMPVANECTPSMHDRGAIYVQDAADRRLRVPQRREFLFPAVFNGGCESEYCLNDQWCPGTRRAEGSPETKAAFAYLFASRDPYGQVTDVASSCSGAKCDSINSAAGWTAAPHSGDELRWMTDRTLS